MTKRLLCVLIITKNEEHHLPACIEQLDSIADQVIVIDSGSEDATVEIAKSLGAKVVHREFSNFGDQWNYALTCVPKYFHWVMKIDPDERISPPLKQALTNFLLQDHYTNAILKRRLWFLGNPLAVYDDVLRVWKNGECRFLDAEVNEHPIVEGRSLILDGILEHLDSVNLEAWLAKQNRYSTIEADQFFSKSECRGIEKPGISRRLVARKKIKRLLLKTPLSELLIFLDSFIFRGAWRSGSLGFQWSLLRAETFRWKKLKILEIRLIQKVKRSS